MIKVINIGLAEETVLTTTMQDGGTTTATAQYLTDHTTAMVTCYIGGHSLMLSSVVK